MALTEEQISEKLEEVKKIQIFLDPDPSTKGLVSLNLKIAEIQLAKDRISALVMDAMRNVAEHDIVKETVQHEHDRQLELLLATDPTVSAQKSAEMRNTHARMKMQDLVLKLHHADIAHIKATWYLKILQSVHSNLESTNSNLSRQITVLQLESSISGGNGGNFNRGVMKNINI